MLKNKPKTRGGGTTTKSKCTAKLGEIIQIDEGMIKDHLGKIVKGTVEETLTALIDADEDKLCNTEGNPCPGRQKRSFEKGYCCYQETTVNETSQNCRILTDFI